MRMGRALSARHCWSRASGLSERNPWRLGCRCLDEDTRLTVSKRGTRRRREADSTCAATARSKFVTAASSCARVGADAIGAREGSGQPCSAVGVSVMAPV